ncbi:unnamed protein product [Cylicocyclus nassatus]|uniref:Uncharacterized protein n=1 Tax=Cylicocyclus nassatus TaxID=53992 RepID=A0AA36HCW1_CYLNA|nr:unnamed protein product [Cylicocyclus nassatus]
MSESPNGGAPGPPVMDGTLFVERRPTYGEFSTLVMFALFVAVFLAMVALLYVIRWVCERMVVDRGVATEGSEVIEEESSSQTEPADEKEMSELVSDSESAKRCYPSTEKMVELLVPKITEIKKERVAMGTLRPCSGYSDIAVKNEQMYVGGLSKRLREPPRYISTLEPPEIRKADQLRQTESGSPALHTGKSSFKAPPEDKNTAATPVLITSDKTPAEQVRQTQIPLSGTQPPLASPGIVSTPGPQSQVTLQSAPASSDIVIVGQSSARSASSADGIDAGARAATGVKITGATVSIKPMRRKGVRKASIGKRTVLPQSVLPEVTTPPQTARAVTPVSSKLSRTTNSST